MIYYHFPNKRALYTCIIRDVFAPITDRVRGAMQADEPPGAQARPPHRHARAVDRRVHPLSCRSSFARSPTAAPISAPKSLALIAGIFAAVRGVIARGRRAEGLPARASRRWRTSRIIAPLVMFRAAAPVRARIKAVRHMDIPDADSRDARAASADGGAARMLAVEVESRK